MNKMSKVVPIAVAPPIPETKKEEYTALRMIERVTKIAVLAGGKAAETDKILPAYSNLGFTQQV